MQATAAGKRGTAPDRAARGGARYQRLTSVDAASRVRRGAGAGTATPPAERLHRAVEQVSGGESKKEGLFEGLSMAQLGAGALAAVTSMLLASRIGIAGSVIGVAVASVVSAVAAHVYRRVFEVSAEKIRTMGSPDGAVQGFVVGDGQTAAATDTPTVAMRVAPQARISIDGAGKHGSVSAGVPADATVTMGADQVEAALTRYSRKHITAGDVRTTGHAVRREKASAAGGVSSQRKTGVTAIVVSVVAALVAVAISAFVIDVITAGQGVGAKPAAVTWTVPSTVNADDVTSDSSAGESSHADGKKGVPSSGAADASAATSDGDDAAASDRADADSESNAGAATGDAPSSGSDASSRAGTGSVSDQSASTEAGSTSAEPASSNGDADSSTSESQSSTQGQRAADNSTSSSASTEAKTQQSAA